jgi:hypothetical protein
VVLEVVELDKYLVDQVEQEIHLLLILHKEQMEALQTNLEPQVVVERLL